MQRTGQEMGEGGWGWRVTVLSLLQISADLSHYTTCNANSVNHNLQRLVIKQINTKSEQYTHTEKLKQTKKLPETEYFADIKERKQD